MCLIFSFLASTHVSLVATAAAANDQMSSSLTHSCVTLLWRTAHHWGDLSEPGMFTFGAFHNSSTSYHFYEVPIFVVSTAHPDRCSLGALVLGLCDTHTRWGRGPLSLLGVQLMGIAGGLIGAVFNALNKRLTVYLHTHRAPLPNSPSNPAFATLSLCRFVRFGCVIFAATATGTWPPNGGACLSLCLWLCWCLSPSFCCLLSWAPV